MRNEAKYRPLRVHARELIVKTGLTQKEVADRLQVAPRTVGAWVRHGRWQEERKKWIERTGRADSLYDFVAYCRENHPSEFQSVETIYKRYLNTL